MVSVESDGAWSITYDDDRTQRVDEVDTSDCDDGSHPCPGQQTTERPAAGLMGRVVGWVVASIVSSFPGLFARFSIIRAAVAPAPSSNRP